MKLQQHCTVVFFRPGTLLSDFPFPLPVTPTRATIKLKYTIHSTSAQLQVCIHSVVFRKYEGVGAFCR
jgi:hypothetical protein